MATRHNAADLQDPPELIPNLIARWREDQADVVFAQRLSRAGETRLKRATVFVFYCVMNALGGAARRNFRRLRHHRATDCRSYVANPVTQYWAPKGKKPKRGSRNRRCLRARGKKTRKLRDTLSKPACRNALCIRQGGIRTASRSNGQVLTARSVKGFRGLCS